MMNIDIFFENIKCIQIKLVDFLENEDNFEENFENLINKIVDEQIIKDHYKFIYFLQLLSKIAKNHYRNPIFLSKLQKIFISLKKEIKQSFSNFDIFDIFKNNKIILLFLINEGIIKIDKSISDVITSGKYIEMKYPEYFFNEIKPFIDEETAKTFSIDKYSTDYEENRKIGENECYICKLIRNDLISDFITYVNKEDLSLQSKIETSIYETNPFLLEEEPKLIEYSAFYGSIHIFRYLYLNNAEVTEKLWLYAIHGNNPELISFLEDKCIEPNNKNYEECLEESIKCHHHDITNYILDNFIDKKDESKYDKSIYAYSFHYRNFLYFPKESSCNFIFLYACEYNYINIVIHFLQNKEININIYEIPTIFIDIFYIYILIFHH